jgi:hypothetical protein
MDKLEQYLDQVCRGIGGPVEMRQHVRQELREHLLDAIAQHKAAGLSDEDALRKALEEFGKPEEVRSELEAAHGQRMTWIIDKAMQWKERTMKAKWLWMTWTYLGLVLVIALEAMFISFTTVMIVPKFQKLMADGLIDPAALEEDGLMWMVNFMENVRYCCEHWTAAILLAAVVLWGLFEWRVRSENKPFIRLSALGTVAVGLIVVLGILTSSMLVMFCLGMPAMHRMARPFALEQVATIDTSMGALDQALAKKDWKTVEDQAERLSTAMNRLSAGPALTALTSWNEGPGVNELRSHVKTAQENLRNARQAIAAKDAEGVTAELAKLRKMLEPVREASKRAPR